MNDVVHVVIMGVSGSGKTTVAGIVADRLGWELAEADDFHPQANIDKMASGHPLDDDDRWPWLKAITQWMREEGSRSRSTVVTCSALKRSYRDVLRQAGSRVVFFHLDGDHELLENRLAARTDHFMPASLIQSQFSTLEPLEADEEGEVIDVTNTPSAIATTIEKRIGAIVGNVAFSPKKHPTSTNPQANVGVYGLGVMGGAIARNFASKGYSVAVTNVVPDVATEFASAYSADGAIIAAEDIGEFVGLIEHPRIICLMVTAGPAVDSVISQLSEYLDPGDVIVDMGNSHFSDTRRREAQLRQMGLDFVGCGTSGGFEGALHGPALMLGGSRAALERVAPILSTIAAVADDGRRCATLVGPDGSGHLVKTLHNGIEYAELELIAEAYDLLRSSGLTPHEISEVMAQWKTTELSSYLIDITTQILATDDEHGVPLVNRVCDRAGHKGTGAWSSQIAVELGVDASILVMSLMTRFASVSELRHIRQNNVVANKTLDVTRVAHALYLAKIIAYSQGLEVISAASSQYNWNIDLGDVVLGWRAGCIIRGRILDDISRALRSSHGGSHEILSDAVFAQKIESDIGELREVVCFAVTNGVPVPGLSAALAYLDTLARPQLPTALIQLQRDYFGSHGFEFIDEPGTVAHGPWNLMR
ncbi:NADP-dependent phosphogluconate dehydrogenase [Arcanobacterium canis]|uniref:6-phosphogluconate dehydrogenase, decarboxylating n=1 Tax=Arcanobacterium canis TaxID=999183 RepID=A0ABY8FZU6_9ACTO|nr:NADP-dependent phosphogluconate dehydrogenase [Arcanobacterium canis]WFM84019.1 NADP-dependent phosphogluconate dehydrogenase [Arcanobacterium canis]